MTEPSTPAQPQPGTMQVHPMAALQEANFDNEVHRNRRLMLANDIHTLTQMVAERDARIKELEAEAAARQSAKVPEMKETE